MTFRLRSTFAVLLGASLWTILSPAGGAEPDRMRFRWPIVAIKDGDTLAVTVPGLPSTLNPVAVRLRGVDTPERGGHAKCTGERDLAERATRFARDTIAAARSVEFEAPLWDKYGGRIDADVWVDGKRLADQLVAAGLARPYEGGKRAGWC